MIAILDFGSQYTQLIARRMREFQIFSEIFKYDVSIEELKKHNPKGIILSGGPNSVHEAGAPKRDIKALAQVSPVLGLCYGMQLISEDFGGAVQTNPNGEYGMMLINWDNSIPGVPIKQNVWMSHGDSVSKIPNGFKVSAQSEGGIPAVLQSERIWAFQFHPEVSHTEHGEELLKAFVFGLCKMQPDWKPQNILDRLSNYVLNLVPENEHVLCALSGGVDSTVVAALLTKILSPEQVHCVFVDNGLLRKNEFENVLVDYKKMGLNVIGLNREKEFLDNLKKITDPEDKRKAIGRLFLEVFENHIKELKNIKWLAQGTLYPDVIESLSPRGASVTIKTHHNVGGLPEKMKLKLVEPLRELFKDEVREIGMALNVPGNILGRHPFPGPGLGIRVVGEVTKESLDILRECDAIFIDELKVGGFYDRVWQAACVLLPVKTVGVQGDSRSYERSVALRAVVSKDGMTADWFAFPHEFLKKVSNRITNEVKKVNRVVYDITSKPPGTIEWE